MNIEVNKTYLTKHGRFVKMVNEPWEGIFNGEYEDDGRKANSITNDVGRWKVDGRAWDYLFLAGEFYTPTHDILMEDSKEARDLANQMKMERKQKAYNETM